MTANSQAKLKLLRIMQMLQDETDATQGLSMSDIIQRLGEQGIQAERKSVYRDIDLLRQIGMDIRTFQRNPVQYAIVQRDFSLADLELLADAVQSCPHLTQRQADGLLRSLKGLAPKAQRSKLSRRIQVPDRPQKKSDSVLNSVDLTHKAFAAKRKLAFDYQDSAVQTQEETKRCAGRAQSSAGTECGGGGKFERHFVLTPVTIVYSGNTYFLTCWDDAAGTFADFRMDRMSNVALHEETAVRNDVIRNYLAQERA